MTLQKTREIPISDFYTLLQLEYLAYKFRSLIYSREYDKNKFIDICKKKRQKIEQIAFENCLPSIFNSEIQKKKYIEKFFGVDNLPKFTYRDDYQKKVKGHWDIYYYYIPGSSVSFSNGDQREIGRIQECKIDEKIVVIKNEDGVLVTKGFCGVTRIFPSDFYSNLFK